MTLKELDLVLRIAVPDSISAVPLQRSLPVNIHRLLPLAFLLAASLRAQDLAYVHNLAPDYMNVSPVEFSAAVSSLSRDAAVRRSGRAPMNLTGDSGTYSFLVPS